MNIKSLIREIDNENMDSNYENRIANIFGELGNVDSKTLLYAYLDNNDYQVRMLGLRLIKRVVKDKKLLEGVIERCFSVERLTELQRWYAAILARYPASKLVGKVKIEFKNRHDESFVARHMRAIQIELANRGESAKAYIDELESYELG